jgi:hypothetical protein
MPKTLYARLFANGFAQGDLRAGDMADIDAAHSKAVAFCHHADIERYFLHKGERNSATPKVFRDGLPINTPLKEPKDE